MFSEGIERDWYDEISFFHLIFDCTTAKLRLLLKRQPHPPNDNNTVCQFATRRTPAAW